jgi:hypothetical protein
MVVCGDFASPGERGTGAAEIARRAAVAGAGVQLVSVVADEAEGDAWLLELGTAGVGHAAVLRESPRPLEGADLDLALRYLPEARVIVVVDAATEVEAVAAEHAAWSGAALVVVRGGSGDRPDPQSSLPDSTIVLEAPRLDPDGTFAGFVGALAARLDAGATPADAWAATTSELAIDPA